MNPLLWNLLLALAWAALSGTFSLATLATGFVVGGLVIALVERTLYEGNYIRRLVVLTGFVGFYLKEVLVSNLRVLHAIVDPRVDLSTGFIHVDTRELRPGEITLLSNLLAMTPGTLPLDVAQDASHLVVHAMFVEDARELEREIEEEFVRRVREVTR